MSFTINPYNDPDPCKGPGDPDCYGYPNKTEQECTHYDADAIPF